MSVMVCHVVFSSKNSYLKSTNLSLFLKGSMYSNYTKTSWYILSFTDSCSENGHLAQCQWEYNQNNSVQSYEENGR
jgi:hypothetical protein